LRKYFDSLLVPQTNERKGCGGEFKASNISFPLVQHNPGVSFGNLSAL